MDNYSFSYRWHFTSSSTPSKLWPYLSDTNQLFKDLGQLPIQPASVSHDLPKGHRELTYDLIHKLDIWEEEPYEWEAPYHLKFRRNYKNGPYKTLLLGIDIAEKEYGSKVTFRFSGEANGFSSLLRIKTHFTGFFKRTIKQVIQKYDKTIQSGNHSSLKRSFFSLRNNSKWEILTNDLTELSNKPFLSKQLIKTLRNGDTQCLKSMKPTALSKLWDQPLAQTLEILFYAAKLDILNFEWEITCPTCRQVEQKKKKLREITGPLFCSYCKSNFDIDFHNTVHLVFRPNPMVRKLDKKTYCHANPSKRPHIKLHQYIYPGQRRFVKLDLPPGSYKLQSNISDSIIFADVEEDGMEHAKISFSKHDHRRQKVTLGTSPNLIIHNQTEERIFVIAEDLDWKEYSVSASEVTSTQLFRNLFPGETLRPEQKLKCSDLTVMFTDLLNSASLYNSEGEENAIGQVIDHFEVLRQIILEERGAIVKTIGDAIMAIFQKPVHAVRAFQKAQYHFNTSTGEKNTIHLKGGIHMGDCVAVSLNNRIDFFGNTINIASRLVEEAKSEEVVISDSALSSRELRDLIDDQASRLKVHQTDVSLKGYENVHFEAKRLVLRNSTLRLVV